MAMMSRELRPSSKRPVPKDKQAEVGLEHFAAIAGMTEREFYEVFVAALYNKGPCGMLKPEAEKDLLEWADELPKKHFLVVFRLSLNRKRDAATYCICYKYSKGIRAIRIEPGLMGANPSHPDGKEWDGFEINFCDMRTNLYG